MQLRALWIDDRRKHRCPLSILSLTCYDHRWKSINVHEIRSNLSVDENRCDYRRKSTKTDVSIEKDPSLLASQHCSVRMNSQLGLDETKHCDRHFIACVHCAVRFRRRRPRVSGPAVEAPARVPTCRLRLRLHHVVAAAAAVAPRRSHLPPPPPLARACRAGRCCCLRHPQPSCRHRRC